MAAITGIKFSGTVENFEEFIEGLESLQNDLPKRAAAAGTRKAITIITRAFRRQIDSSTASARMKRAAKKTIGWRFAQGGIDRLGKTHEPIAKTGFGVGKFTKAKRAVLADGMAAKVKRGGGGVGLSTQNIHWPILGTKERATKKGVKTGKMPPVLKGLAQQAVSASGTAALQAFAESATATLQRMAAKMKLKKAKRR